MPTLPRPAECEIDEPLGRCGVPCLSTSYSIADSHIYIYANPINEGNPDKFLEENSEIPLYFLDNGNIEKTITL
jgi:hypothetical protein